MPDEKAPATPAPTAASAAPAATVETAPPGAGAKAPDKPAGNVPATAKEGEVSKEVKAPEGTAEVPPAKKEKKAPVLAKVKAREAAVETKAKELESRENKIKEFEAGFNKDAFKKSPTKFLAKYGLTFEDVAEAVLNEGDPETPKTDAQIALEKIQAVEKQLKEEREGKDEEDNKNKQAYIDRVFADYKKRIVAHIDENEDKYELVKLNEKQDLVFEIQEAYHAKHGTVLDLDKACEIAENYLLKGIQKVIGAKKLQQFIAPPKESNGAKTLSSNLAAASSSSASPGVTLSKDERLRRAAEKLQFVN